MPNSNSPRGAPNHAYAHTEIHPYVKPEARGVPDNTNYYPSPGNANQVYPKPGEGPRAMSDTGIPEAPTDGTQYGRQNMAWTPIVLPPADPPADNYTYGRRNSAWTPVPEEAPDDTVGYVRMGRLWVPQAVAAVQEAPLDGRGYMRQSAAWQPLPDAPDGGGIPDAPNDGNIYARQSLGWVAVEQPALGAEVTLKDGAGQVVLPDWEMLEADQLTMGTAVTVNADGSVTCNVSGAVIIQVAIDVTHNWGSFVIFGFSTNDGAVEELGRVQVQSNEPVRVSARYEREVQAATTLKLWVGSNFEYAQFSWANGVAQMFAQDATGLPEAPQDGKTYGRNNATWKEVQASAAGIPEAPADGSYYTRRNAAWAATTKATMGLGNVDNTSDANKPVSTATQTALNAKLGDAPSDGKQYARKNAAWSEVTSSGGGGDGLPEAPLDGKQYARQSGAWTENTGGVVGPSGTRFDDLFKDSVVWRIYNIGTTSVQVEGGPVITTGTQVWLQATAAVPFGTLQFKGAPAGVGGGNSQYCKVRNTSVTPNLNGFRYGGIAQNALSANGTNDKWQFGVLDNSAFSSLQTMTSSVNCILFGRDPGDTGNMRIVVRAASVTTQDIDTGIPYAGTPVFSFEIDARKPDAKVTAKNLMTGQTFSTTIVAADLPLPTINLTPRIFYTNGNVNNSAFNFISLVAEMFGRVTD